MQKGKVIVVIQTLNQDGLDHIFALIRYNPPRRSNTYLFWLFCLDPLVLLLPKRLIILVFQSFYFERTWWWLFQKRVVRTNFDIYGFISIQHMKCSPVHFLIPIWHPFSVKINSTSRMAVHMAYPAILGLFVGEMSVWYLRSFICRWHYTHDKCYFPSISWIWGHSHKIIAQ